MRQVLKEGVSYFIKGDIICIRIADGLNKRSLMVCKVFEFHNPTLALNEVYNGLSDPAFVEAIFSMSCKFAESLGKVWELDDLAGKGSLSVQ